MNKTYYFIEKNIYKCETPKVESNFSLIKLSIRPSCFLF